MMLSFFLNIYLSCGIVPGMFESEACECQIPGTPLQDPDLPPDPDLCYDPLCPAGYYLCCYQCEMANCAHNNDEMILSRRGRKECIPCAPGDICQGCDLYEECPTDPDEQGKLLISKKGSKSIKDCEQCVGDYQASYDRATCEPNFRDACNQPFMKKCMSGCFPMYTECDRMKCMVTCAKEWSPKCLEKFEQICNYFLKPPIWQLSKPLDDENASVFFEDTSSSTTTSNILVDCDVDCSKAYSVLVWLPMLLLL